MARQLDRTPLRENGPIIHMPNWQLPPSPCPLAPAEADNPQGAHPPGREIRNPQPEIAPRAAGSSDSLNPEPQTLNHPSLSGRPRALDEAKQATICNLIAAGVSLRQAARFVECNHSSICREAQRNDVFRRQLAKARAEASVHPMVTLRQAAKSNWRAALCWMERLDPDRFARPDASVVRQSESNQFVVNLVESIEQSVSDPRERGDLFELLSAVLPAPMRRRWNSRHLRGKVEQTKMAEDDRRGLERAERDRRRFELFREIGRHLPYELLHKLRENVDLLDPEEVFIKAPPASAQRACAGAAPPNGAPTNGNSITDGTASGDLTSDDPPSAGPTNNPPPADSFATPPVQN